MNSPCECVLIVSPAFHIGLPGVFNHAPGELPSYRFHLQTQSNTPEPANHSLQGYWLISDRLCWSRAVTEICRTVALQEQVEIPDINSCKEYWSPVIYFTYLYLQQICVHVCPYMSVSVCVSV